jgi:CRP/FNR family cyclic AMP-dependent transcriptional regulator
MAIVSKAHRRPEDPLEYLRCSTVLAYPRGHTIYDYERPPANLHLVIDGYVKICRMSEGRKPVVLDIYQAEDFFGESAFLGAAQRPETAVALEDTKVMVWSVEEIEEIAIKHPQLGIALLQLIVRRSAEYVSRIESFAVDNIARRLARALIRFSERNRNEAGAPSEHLVAFTHELLSQYVGTSREIVTQCMNQFRRAGYLSYSRRGIVLHGAELRTWLATGGDFAGEKPARPRNNGRLISSGMGA